jgi:hypothetical protein
MAGQYLQKKCPAGVYSKKRKENFPHIKVNSEGIRCKVIYEEGLPKI